MNNSFIDYLATIFNNTGYAALLNELESQLKGPPLSLLP
jgi:hypothetical protein